MLNMIKVQLHIGIVGAGIAGLASAFTLLKAGHKVSLFEKNSELAELGAGIQLSPNATRLLEQWGLLSKIQTFAVMPDGVRFLHWKNAKAIADFPLNHLSVNHSNAASTPYLHIHRGDLYQCLLDSIIHSPNLTLHLDENLLSVFNEKDSCTISTHTKKNETNTYNFDYLIGADGVHSLCREYVQKNSSASFTGNVAWRGLIPSENLVKQFPKKAHLVMAPDSHLVFYYVKRGHYLNYVAVKERSDFKNESWTEKGSIENLLQDFSAWHSDYLDILKQSDPDNIYRWALYDREPLNTWHNGRCIILGDAAHPILPYLAQGAAMALEDADALASCFKTHSGERIGEQFFSLRAARCKKVLDASRSNRTLYHEKNIIKREVRDSGSSIFSKVYPEFLNNKLAWLYEHQ